VRGNPDRQPIDVLLHGLESLGARAAGPPLAESRRCIVDLLGRVAVQSLVGTAVVVVVEVAGEALEECVHASLERPRRYHPD